MSCSSRSASPSLANTSDTSRSTPDKDTVSSTSEIGEDEFARGITGSPSSSVSITPKPIEQDEAILAASLSKSPLQQLMERTGCGIVQVNGQRHYGPPSDWTGPPPPRGSEVFVGKIPRDCFEDEIVPIFERIGYIYEVRLMMEYTGQNRGYAFVVFSKPSEAKECIRQMNNYEIRKGRYLGVCISVDNCRLFVGGIPKRAQKEEVIIEISKVTDGVVDVIMYPSAQDKTKNRGFAFIEYECHRAAAMARRKLMSGGIQLWGHQIAVDWAEPEIEPDEEVMSQVKVLYVRNLMLTTTEHLLHEAFSYHAPVERVKKIRDYAFVHFETRDGAMKALKALNGSMLDGSIVEVSLAKPVDKDTYQRSPRFCRVLSPYNTGTNWGYVPWEYAAAAAAAMMWGTPSYFPTQTVRPAMTSAGSRAYSSRSPTRGRYCFPSQPTSATASAMTPPPTRFYSPPPGYYRPFVYPTPLTPATATSATQYGASPTKQPQQRRGHGKYYNEGATQMMMADSTTMGSSSPQTMKKSPLQVLEDICMKQGWGAPVYTLHSTTSSNIATDLQLFIYHIRINALGVTFQPTKLSPTIEDAQRIAAEYCLLQLGYSYTPESYTPHGTPAASPVRLQTTTFPSGFFTANSTNTTTTAKLFPGWQYEPPQQTSTGMLAYEIPSTPHQQTNNYTGDLYPASFLN